MILRTIQGALALASAKVVMARVSSSSQAKRPGIWTMTGTPVSRISSGASTGAPPALALAGAAGTMAGGGGGLALAGAAGTLAGAGACLPLLGQSWSV